MNKVVNGNNHLFSCMNDTLQCLMLHCGAILYHIKIDCMSFPVHYESRQILNFPGKTYSFQGLQLEPLTGLFSSHHLSIRHCDLHFMSSDLRSALELLQLNNYGSGMATISFSLMKFTDRCSRDNHCCRI